MPAPAATASSTIAMPASRATLSAVPKSAIAVSFAQGGAASISAPPIAANGLDSGAIRAADSSPMPAPSTAEATPANAAASVVRVLRVSATLRA